MRLIARLPNIKQASFLIDSLRNEGFDRKDLIVSDLVEEQKFDTFEQAAEELPLIKTERDSISELGTFTSGIKEFEGKSGIVVAVETPKHETTRVREMMEQSGAIEIIQD